MARTVRQMFSYARFSSLGQEKHSDGRPRTSIERQVSMSEDYVAELNGKGEAWVLNNSIAPDKGKSAYKGKHVAVGNFKAFLDMVREGQIPEGSGLAIEAIDRTSRMPLDDGRQLIEGIMRAGIEIHLLRDREVYRPKDLNDLSKCLTLAVKLDAAHQYSRNLSERLSYAWNKRRENVTAEGKVYTRQCPGWVRPLANGKGFEKIPERVAVIRRIQQMTLEGMGRPSITRTLNEEKVPTFGRAKEWDQHYIRKLITERSLLGEFQLRSKGKPVGNVIPDYFPVVFTQTEFDRLQESRESRRHDRGRRGTCRNVFGNLLKDKASGTTMVMQPTSIKGTRTYNLIPHAACRGSVKEWIGFPLRAIEFGLLYFLKELDLSEARPATHKLDTLARELDGIRSNLAAMKARLKARYSDTIADTIDEQEAELGKVQEEYERERAEQNKDPNVLGDIRELAARIQLKGDATELRQALAAKLRLLIERIDVEVEQEGKEKHALCTIHLRGKKQTKAVSILARPNGLYNSCELAPAEVKEVRKRRA